VRDFYRDRKRPLTYPKLKVVMQNGWTADLESEPRSAVEQLHRPDDTVSLRQGIGPSAKIASGAVVHYRIFPLFLILTEALPPRRNAYS